MVREVSFQRAVIVALHRSTLAKRRPSAARLQQVRA
jgi:hypothetical protein